MLVDINATSISTLNGIQVFVNFLVTVYIG